MRAHLWSLSVASFIALAFASLAHVACDDSSNAIKEPAPDSGRSGNDSGPLSDGNGPGVDGGDAGPSDCFLNPKTHFEIINACTTAVKITKNPTLTKLQSDGGLPPLN